MDAEFVYSENYDGNNHWRILQNNALKVATISQCNALGSNDVVITPGNIGATFDAMGYGLGTYRTGYTKMPNGTIIQYGTTAVAIRQGGTIYFPVTFPNHCHAVTLTCLYPGASGIGMLKSKANSNFVWHDVSVSILTDAFISWIAVGN